MPESLKRMRFCGKKSWIVTAAVIAAIGAVIHIAAIAGGPAWFAFFGAPPVVVRSAEEGTWLAPVSACAIAMAMGLCSAYAAAAAGFLRTLPLQKIAIPVIALICLLRGFILIPLIFVYPGLLNTFEVIAAIIWSVAGAGFGIAFLYPVQQ